MCIRDSRSVLEQVEKRNSNEKEFLDAVKEVALSLVPVFDKHPEYIRAVAYTHLCI